jgi:hypothetical protein
MTAGDVVNAAITQLSSLIQMCLDVSHTCLAALLEELVLITQLPDFKTRVPPQWLSGVSRILSVSIVHHSDVA